MNDFIPFDITDIHTFQLACPVCGDIMIHPVAIECRSPGTEKGNVRIDSDGIHLDPTKPAIDSGVMITLTFHCECGHVFEYEFHFDHGSTYFKRRMRNLSNDPAYWPNTIWRN
jgi:hypothetical protein